MKKFLVLIAVCVWCSVNLFAQNKVKTYQMYETDWIKPKMGHTQQFEDAVKALTNRLEPYIAAYFPGSGNIRSFG
jgi:hypothetical protein